MERKIILFKFGAIISMFLALSCSTDNTEEAQFSSEKKADVTVSEAKKFLADYTSAKATDKENIITNFTKKNKIDINESQVLTQTALNTYTPEQLGSVIPVYGGTTGIIPTIDMAGSLIKRRVEWVVMQNTMGLWRIKSFENITHTLTGIQQAYHEGTRFEGVTMGILSWQEMNSAGNVQIVGMQNQVLSIVQGTVHITGWYDIPVDNYCVFSIY